MKDKLGDLICQSWQQRNKYSNWLINVVILIIVLDNFDAIMLKDTIINGVPLYDKKEKCHIR